MAQDALRAGALRGAGFPAIHDGSDVNHRYRLLEFTDNSR